jgi:hypothetical protein
MPRELKIVLADAKLITSLFGAGKVDEGDSLELPGIGILTLRSVQPRRTEFHPSGLGSVTLPPAICVVLSLAKDVSVGLVSAWLYDRLRRGKQEPILIDGRTVERSEDGITRAVERKAPKKARRSAKAKKIRRTQ